MMMTRRREIQFAYPFVSRASVYSRILPLSIPPMRANFAKIEAERRKCYNPPNPQSLPPGCPYRRCGNANEPDRQHDRMAG